MSTSRKHGRVERQQGYAAARAVAEMARKLRGKKLSNEEARALTQLASQAAGGSARVARKVTSGGKGKRRSRRSAIRSETRRYVRTVTGASKRGGKKGSSRKSYRGWTPSRRADAKFRSTWTRSAYGPKLPRKERRSRRSASSSGAASLPKKEWLARRIQTSRDYGAYKKYRAANFGPSPFEVQPSWLRASASKKERAQRARWAKARSSR